MKPIWVRERGEAERVMLEHPQPEEPRAVELLLRGETIDIWFLFIRVVRGVITQTCIQTDPFRNASDGRLQG